MLEALLLLFINSYDCERKVISMIQLVTSPKSAILGINWLFVGSFELQRSTLEGLRSLCRMPLLCTWDIALQSIYSESEKKSQSEYLDPI